MDTGVGTDGVEERVRRLEGEIQALGRRNRRVVWLGGAATAVWLLGVWGPTVAKAVTDSLYFYTTDAGVTDQARLVIPTAANSVTARFDATTSTYSTNVQVTATTNQFILGGGASDDGVAAPGAAYAGARAVTTITAPTPAASRTCTIPDAGGDASLVWTTSNGSTAQSITTGSTGNITLDSGTTGNVNLGTGNNAKAINVGTGTAGDTINIGTGAATNPITIGNTTGNTSVTLLGAGTGHVVIGGGATATELRFKEPSGSGVNYTAFKAAAQAGDVTYTLPIADGTSGQYLSTNGAGTLSWKSGMTMFTCTNGTNLTSGSTWFTAPGFVPFTVDTVRRTRAVMTRAGTLKNLFVHVATAPAATTDTFTIMINGVASIIVASVVATTTSASDTANTASVIAGDEVNVQMVIPGTSTRAIVSWELEYP